MWPIPNAWHRQEIRNQTVLFLSDQLGEYPIPFYILNNMTVTAVKQIFILCPVICIRCGGYCSKQDSWLDLTDCGEKTTRKTDEHKIQVQPGQEIGGKGIKHRTEWGSGGILDMTWRECEGGKEGGKMEKGGENRRGEGKEVEEKTAGLHSGDFDLCHLGSLGSILMWNGHHLTSGCQRSLWGTISFTFYCLCIIGSIRHYILWTVIKKSHDTLHENLIAKEDSRTAWKSNNQDSHETE